MDSNSDCRLCGSDDTEFVCHQDQFKRNFYRCCNCDIHFAEGSSLLTPKEEKSRYSHHNNSDKSPGYVAFLSKLLDPVLERVNKNHDGLDFGSGPYPMLQELALERGYKMNIYDPFYADDISALAKKYDYVTSCEVVEHFHRPGESFDVLMNLLRPEGRLGIMTSILFPEIDFSSWHYIRDDTHVCFYTPKTLKWIAKKWNLEIVYQHKNVVIFQSLRKIKG